MNSLFRALPLAGCLVLAASCASGPGNLKKTAAIDFSCSQKQLEVEQLDKSKAGTTWLVTGCGKTAQYAVSKKVVTRTTDITEAAPPPPPQMVVAAPPPQEPAGAAAPLPGQDPEQQARLQAFMAGHNQQTADTQARQQAFFAQNQARPPAPVSAPAPAPAQAAAAPAPAPAASTSSSSSQAGWVCLNNQYFSCPTSESTLALGAYSKCRIRCMMGGGKCSDCVLGAGEQCTRQPTRDPDCKQ